MKNIITLLLAFIVTLTVFAQDTKKQLPDPFKGGVAAMTRYFNDSVKITPEIRKRKATGLVVMKFTADVNGYIRKLIVYYADDVSLAVPVAAALQQTNAKWAIPDHYQFYDFVLPVTINYNAVADARGIAQKAMFEFYKQRKPILAADQVPLNTATLLPAVVINYQ